MKIVAAYIPKVVPKTYKTAERHCKIVRHYVQDADGNPELDEHGKKIKAGPNTLEYEDRESMGGILFKMPRGHSIRLTSPEQIKQFRLTDKPFLVDLDSGEQVDESGTPISLAGLIKGDSDMMMNSGGDFGEAPADEGSE